MIKTKCTDCPKATHGFDRNGSHNKGEYVCECESQCLPCDWVYTQDENFDWYQCSKCGAKRDMEYVP